MRYQVYRNPETWGWSVRDPQTGYVCTVRSWREAISLLYPEPVAVDPEFWDNEKLRELFGV